jgi:biotin-dependent carboxylase-like uncharacterized protein
MNRAHVDRRALDRQTLGPQTAGTQTVGTETVEVVRPGALTTVQDSGRPGFAHLGVPASGALDPDAYARANRLVGNAETAAVLESTVDGVSLRFDAPAVVAITGARAAVLVDGRPEVWSLPVYVPAGSLVEVGPAELGVRSYLAVAGGFDVPATLGSKATDLLSGLGPPALVSGQRLAVGPAQGPPPAIDFAPYPMPPADLVLPLHPGPRRDWLTAQGQHDLFDQTYRVSPNSNRIALRLSGPPLDRRLGQELPSEGIVWGSVELLNSGEVLVFLADHPTTGGYPVIAIVDRSAASDCAQARPGTVVTLRRARGASLADW